MTPREAFRELTSHGVKRIEVDRAALLIAAEEYPDLPLERYLADLDRLATRVGERLHRDAGPREILARMNRVLVEEEGFRGNSENYYDPRNSYLNEVLDRRTGIPITLSLVYIEVGRRVGFALQGVGFPGHFLVKHKSGDAELVVDPFASGRILTEDDCRSRLVELFGRELEFQPAHLEASSPRQMLVRMLYNLKSIYSSRQDDRRALAAVERILLLKPGALGEVRDRGLLLSRLNRPLEALADLARYRRERPRAKDASEVDDLMESLRWSIGISN